MTARLVTRALPTLSVAALLALVLVPPAAAQTVAGTIVGTVTDPNGQPVPGATVTASGEGAPTSATTADDGTYRLTPLEPGSYSVTVARDGFQTKTLTDVVLNVSRTVSLDVPLEVEAVEAEVTVVAAPPLLDFQDPAQTSIIDSTVIETQPLNGRNYLDLVLLTPGVVVNTNARSDFGDLDTSGAILGERAGNTAFLVDGHENNDDLRGGVFLDYNQDTIREFEVIQSGYKAEFGRGSGGVVNVVTRSGGDDVQASAYGFVRDDSWDSSNVEGQDAPKLERDDYGFTLGGPFSRGRSWYFTSGERIDETREAIFPQDVPPLLLAMEDFSRQPESENTRAFFKWSHQANDSNDLKVDLGWSDGERLNELAAADSLPSNSNNNETDTLNANAALTTVLSADAFLESSLNFRDQSFEQNQGLGDAGTSFSLVLLDAPGAGASFGPPAGSVIDLDQQYLGARGALSAFRGPHSLKGGLQYLNTEVDGVNGQGLIDVIVTFTPLFNVFGLDSFKIPQGVALIDPGDEITRLRNDGVAVFGQDDWAIGDDVTLSLGARWDYDSEFDDSDNVAPRLGLVWRLGERTMLRANAGLFYDRYRLGIAQTVPELGGIDQTTVVEFNYPRLMLDAVPLAGSLGRLAAATRNPALLHQRYGLSPDVVLTRDNVQALTGLSPDAFIADVNAFVVTFGVPLLPLEFSPATGLLRQNVVGPFVDSVKVEQPFDTPSNTTFSLGVEHQLGASALVTATVLHREIDDVLGVRITNLSPQSRVIGIPITTDGLPLARTYGGFYDGEVDAAVLTFEKRFAGRYQLLTSYTYTDAEDNLLNSNLGLGILTQGGGAVPTDNLDLEVDRGTSDLAVEHGFVMSGTAVLPLGFTLSGALRLQSGLRFSAAGTLVDVDGDGISSSRPLTTERNQFEGPSYQNLDVRLEKRFRLGDRHELAVLAEAFNVTNEANARLIDNGFVGGAPVANFGGVRVPVSGREIQLGVRWRMGG
jgi:outer membrane receptor for ferrienterochelin and colicin